MLTIGDNGPESAALQRILETTHSLQMRVFRAVLRRQMNDHAVGELAMAAEAIAAAVEELREIERGDDPR